MSDFMLKGIGTDLLEIFRVEKIYQRHGERFIRRILTKAEISESQTRKNISNYLAKQFAAKEAISKALGVGIGVLGFHDMEVLRNSVGQPQVTLSSKARKQFLNPKIHLSLSDTKTHILAFCIIEN